MVSESMLRIEQKPFLFGFKGNKIKIILIKTMQNLKKEIITYFYYFWDFFTENLKCHKFLKKQDSYTILKKFNYLPKVEFWKKCIKKLKHKKTHLKKRSTNVYTRNGKFNLIQCVHTRNT